MSRKLPITSHIANKAMTPEMREAHKKKITDTLAVLRVATCDKIAEVLGLHPIQVGRRMTELEKENRVYKPGSMSNTRSNRTAYEYALTGVVVNVSPVQKTIRGKGISDYSKKISSIQKSLF